MTKTLIQETVKKRVKGEARKKQQKNASINENGSEILDERPLFHDAGFRQPESMNDKIRRITMQVQQETVAKLAAQNMTQEEMERILDEEDDFEIPEDYDDTLTKYEAAGLLSELKDDTYLITPAKPPSGEELEPPIDTDSVDKEPEKLSEPETE